MSSGFERHGFVYTVAGLLCGCGLLLVHTASAAPGDTVRVSVSSTGEQGNNVSDKRASLSRDGRFIAFETAASNFFVGDGNGRNDVFVQDRLTGTTELVSYGSVIGSATAGGAQPSISASGRYVAFVTPSSLVPADTNAELDVYVHDRETGARQLVSVAAAGGAGNDDSYEPSISADGRFVAFVSGAWDLVPGDTNSRADVFVRDLVSGTTERASVSSAGAQAIDFESRNPSISGDGRYVAFSSAAANLVPGDSNLKIDVFVRDRQGKTTRRVSLGYDGSEANGPSFAAAFSADGRFVAFQSAASNLVPGDTGFKSDVFVFDRQTGTSERVSVSTAGTQGNNDSEAPAISADGRYVAFSSRSSNLIEGDTNFAADIFVRDRWATGSTGSTERVNVSSSGGQAVDYSSFDPAISGYGRFVSFQSLAANLVSGDTNAKSDVFVHERSVPSWLSAFSLKQDVVAGCKSVSGVVTLLNPAPAGGLVVTLSDTLPSASPPATITVAAGTTSKSFSIKTSPVAALQSGSVSATVADEVLVDDLAVRPMGPLSVSLSPFSIVGGLTGKGTVKLECAAGPGPVTVDLSSSNAAVAAPVAASIVVPQGSQSASFDIATKTVLAKSTANITGTANGLAKSKRLTVNVAASVSPTSLKFGSLPVGQTSAPLSTVLKNNGAVAFSITSIALTGTSATWFAQTSTCGSTLAPGASCTISVTFSPLAAASKSAKLVIATSATSTPLSVSVSGTGQ
jgi:Tol biopolymer transport system component